MYTHSTDALDLIFVLQFSLTEQLITANFKITQNKIMSLFAPKLSNQQQKQMEQVELEMMQDMYNR